MPAITKNEKQYSFSDYIELEKETNIRHELFYGEVFNLAGGTIKHSKLIFSSSSVINQLVLKRNCITLTNDVKLELEAD